MTTLLRNLFVIAFLIGIVYLAVNFSGPVKGMISSALHMPDAKVMGASTKRFDEKLHQDINGKVDNAKNQVLNVKVGDAVNFFSTVAKLSGQAQEFVNTQINNFTGKK